MPRFFRELYTKVTHRLFLEGLDWVPLYNAKASWLEKPFEEHEVKGAIWK